MQLLERLDDMEGINHEYITLVAALHRTITGQNLVAVFGYPKS